MKPDYSSFVKLYETLIKAILIRALINALIKPSCTVASQTTPPRIEPADLPRMASDTSASPLSHGQVVEWAGRARRRRAGRLFLQALWLNILAFPHPESEFKRPKPRKPTQTLANQPIPPATLRHIGRASIFAGQACLFAGQEWHIAGQAWHIAGQAWHIAGQAWHIAGQAWHIAGQAWHIARAGMAYCRAGMALALQA